MRETGRLLWYTDQIFHTQTNTPMYIEFLKVRVYPAAIILSSMVSSVFSPVYAEEKPHVQQFVVTAYYSPLPDQCCYFRGNYEEEIAFNGKGIAGADGTGVYPGMIAGPDTYAFGTVIDLPGIGVGTIHDRGGRIIEWGEDIHRIDLWMGYGEPGLARALAWGVRNVKGTVYPLGSTNIPAEKFALEDFDADSVILTSLPKSDPMELVRLAEFGDQEYSVRILQSSLKELGYFAENPTGQFGPVTQEALRKFQAEYGVQGDGTSVTLETAAALSAASSITEKNLPELALGLQKGATGQDVKQAQKLLRYIGYYRGRTDGIFDQDLKESVTAFQINAGIVPSATDQFAGRIGPATRAAMLKEWKIKIVRTKAASIARIMNITDAVQSKEMPKKFLAKGDSGKEVKLLQSFLIKAGYLDPKDTTGTFGGRTAAALLKYQLDRKIIAKESAKGAGVYGPATRIIISQDMVAMKWNDVWSGR